MRLIRKAKKIVLKMNKEEWLRLGKAFGYGDEPDPLLDYRMAGELAAKQGKSRNVNPFRGKSREQEEAWDIGYDNVIYHGGRA